MKKTNEFKSARSAGDAFLGVEVSWDMGDNAIDIKIPREKFIRLVEGVKGVPNRIVLDPETPENNLPRAARIGWSHIIGVSSGLITVKQLSRPDKDTPLAFGVYYRVSVEGERDRLELGARVRVDKSTGDVVVRSPQDTDHYPSEVAKKWADAIAGYSNAVREFVFNSHVSDALIAIGNSMGWVSRRVAGGVYFLPGEAGQAFMEVLDGLEALTEDNEVQFQGNVTPQYADPRTLQTWQRRTQATFDTEISALVTKLADMTSRDNVRESTFDLRVVECAELISRANRYKSVLQEQLGPLTTQLEKLKTQFGDAQANLRKAKGKAETAFASIQQMADGDLKRSPKKKAKKLESVSIRPKYSQEQLDRLFGT